MCVRVKHSVSKLREVNSSLLFIFAFPVSYHTMIESSDLHLRYMYCAVCTCRSVSNFTARKTDYFIRQSGINGEFLCLFNCYKICLLCDSEECNNIS